MSKAKTIAMWIATVLVAVLYGSIFYLGWVANDQERENLDLLIEQNRLLKLLSERQDCK